MTGDKSKICVYCGLPSVMVGDETYQTIHTRCYKKILERNRILHSAICKINEELQDLDNHLERARYTIRDTFEKDRKNKKR